MSGSHIVQDSHASAGTGLNIICNTDPALYLPRRVYVREDPDLRARWRPNGTHIVRNPSRSALGSTDPKFSSLHWQILRYASLRETMDLTIRLLESDRTNLRIQLQILVRGAARDHHPFLT